MKNILISIAIAFFVFIFTNSVSASVTNQIQPANTQVIDQELQVLGTARVYSLRVGTQGHGGVTYFNGTIINETTNVDTGAEIPVTFGDDVRIDGQVWRGATSGPEANGNTPFVINDNLEILGTIQGSDLIGVSQLTTSNTGSSGQILSLNSSGALEWIDGSSGSSSEITEITAGSGLSGGGTSGAVILSVSGVTSSMITDGTITTADIADNTITTAKILNGTIAGADLTSTYQSGSAYDSRFLNDDTNETMTGSLTINNTLTVSSGTSTGITVSGSPTSLISATNSGSGVKAIYGYANSTSGVNYGGYFKTDSNTAGVGVYGRASGISGQGVGGRFISNGSDSGSVGVYGEATGTFGVGVYGIAAGSATVAGGFNGNVEISDGLLKLNITDDPGTCDGTNKGAIYYDISADKPCYCNSASWKTIDAVGSCS